MPSKSNNDKRKEAEAAGRKKMTKQQENAGKSQKAKREEQKARKASKKDSGKQYL